MGLRTDAAVVNIEGNTQQLVDQINKADKAMQNFDNTLTDILKHLTAVENGMNKVSNVTNNIKKQTNYKSTTYDLGSYKKVVKGQNGFMGSDTGTEKAFQDYQQAIINETKEITADVAERKRLRQQRADSERKRAANEAARIAKKEDQSTEAYRKRMDKLATAKLLNAQNQAGSLNRNWGYQSGKMLEAVGGAARQFGVGGRVIGDVLGVAGAMLIAPAAGVMTIFSKLGQGMIDFSKAATQAYAEIEAIKTQLGVVFSNQTQADAMFGQISKYAVKSPFGVQQTSELAVLLKQSGVYASDLMDTLRMLGDTAGGNMEKMKRIANNYAQIVSIGKASMLDMRQFAYAGIPIFEAVSKELGVSQQELRKLISDGKVTSDIIEKVFKDLTGINGLFENATEKGAKTLKARLQNLADARQLAFGQIGEWGVKLGTQTGGDSFVNKLVDIAEKMYDHLKTKVSTVNIEKDVQTFATRNDNIERYKTLIKFAKGIGSKSLEAAFTDKLNKELAKLNPDEARSTYVQSYQNKTRGFDLLNSNNVTGTVASIQQEISELYEKINSLDSDYWKRQSINEANPEHTLGRILLGKYAASRGDSWFGSAPRGSDEALQKEALQERARVLEEILNALKDYNNISDELRRAIKEDAAIQAQQLAFDTTNRNADASTSLNTSFNELASLYESSEEYKKKEEEKKLAILTNAQNELKGIAQKADENGNVRFNEFDRNEFQRLNAAGAFNATKLDIVEGNKQLTAENRAKLESQFANASGKILEEFAGSRLADTIMGKEAMKEFQTRFMSLASAGSDEDFFKQFGSVITDMSNALKQLENFNPADREWLQNLQQYLIQSTNSYEARVKGVNADLTTTETAKAAEQFVPLWKRILAQYTGLSTLEMTSTADTMKKYSEDMAIRNMTSNVMTAAMKSMGVDTAMRLVSAGGAKQLKEDSAGTLQVNWKQTQENIKKFSLALSASTEVVSAYKKSLEDELEVYQQLIVAGYTQGENQNGGESQFISVKKLAQYAQSNEQLVNAFGDTLETASGKKYSVDDLRFTQEGIFDKFGNKIDDQVKVTSNLSRFIEGILPKLYDDIHNATASELNNKMLNNYLENALPAMTLGNYIKANGVSLNTELISQNPEYAKTFLNSKLTALKTSDKYKAEGYDALSNEDILLTWYTAAKRIDNIRPRINELKNKKNKNKAEKSELEMLEDEVLTLTAQTDILNDAFSSMDSNLRKLTSTVEGNTVLEEFKNNEKNLAVLTELIKLGALSANLKSGNQAVTAEGNVITSTTALKPESYKGTRGVSNRILKYGFGLSRDYDLDDLYIQAAKTENLAGQEKNQFGINADKFKELENEDEILKALSAREKAWIRITKAQEDSLQVLNEYSNEMLHTFAEVGKGTWEKPFEKMGENLVLGKEASEGMDDVFKNLTAELLTASGQAMVKAGWELVARGAADRNYAMIAGGLALAGAGAFTAGMGNAVTQEDKETKEAEDKARRLEALRNNLADLLKQAREDAIYYENTLRHKKALSANDSFTTRSVHDAIITPRGDVVTTDPKDYLIATKTPKTLIGSGAPTINFNVIDKSTGIKVTQQRSTYNESTNSIDFEAIIESKVTEVIASSKGDDAFNAREARLRGRSVIA